MTRLLYLADAIRRETLAAVLTPRWARRVYADPRRRIPAAQILAVVASAGLALRAPLVSLWLGAAVLGVPHVVAGVRHTALRVGLSPVTGACALLAFALGIGQLGGLGSAALRAFVPLFAIGIAAEVLRARTGPARVAALLVVTAALAALTAARPALVILVLAHVHGLASIAYFAVRARQRGISSTPLVVGAIGLSVAALVGALDPWMPATLWAPRSAVSSIVAEAVGSSLGSPGALVFRRMLFLYAFGQSLHFAVWLRLMPEVDRDSPVPKTFRTAWRGFRDDFGRWAIPLTVLSVAAAPLMLIGGGSAREVYFALTYFHVGLEGAALAHRLARAGKPADVPAVESAPVAAEMPS